MRAAESLARALAAALLALPLAAAAADPPPRATRHALIVGIGDYAPSATRPIPTLPGVPHDMASALAMARRMQVPPEQTTVLRDAEATHEGVRAALAALARRVAPGDRVFLYWSGHGSRHYDAQEGGCVESLVPHDGRDIGNRQLAQWLQPIARQADKMLVFYDACHSGGLLGAARGGAFVPRFTPGPEACRQPSNLRTRSLPSAAAAAGIPGGDIVHLSSARPDEVAFDRADIGGVATAALRDCLLGGAADADGSGSVSMAEVAACAQRRVDGQLAGQAGISGQTLVLGGNPQFVPAAFASAPPVAPAAAARPLPLGGLLDQIHAQRDSKRRVEVRSGSERLRIGQDTLDLAISSSHDGHVHIAMLGSDGRSLTLLFPNALDDRNRIAAGQTLLLPRPGWRVGAGGPAGDNRLLVLVTDGPRDLGPLQGRREGPFLVPLTDADGRARLQWLLGRNPAADCRGAGCSDAYGAALITVSEY